ncbi:zinc finger protein 420-like [Littorina saxatilis]|uniref:C2H2-type domain-containing protein n=1 Tax=Littorina saxatilis TaxID=31220 RepID=A0AAN9AYY5_9CAEN
MEGDTTMDGEEESVSLEGDVLRVWCQIGKSKGLASHSDIATFLIQSYQSNADGEDLLGKRCIQCNALLTLLCPQCHSGLENYLHLDDAAPESSTSATVATFPSRKPQTLAAMEKESALLVSGSNLFQKETDSRMVGQSRSGTRQFKKTELKLVLPLKAVQQSLQVQEVSESEPDCLLSESQSDDSDDQSAHLEGRKCYTPKQKSCVHTKRGRKRKATRGGKRVVKTENSVTEELDQSIKVVKEEIQHDAKDADVGIAADSVHSVTEADRRQNTKNEAEENKDSKKEVKSLLEEVVKLSQSVVSGKKCFNCQMCDAEFGTSSQMKRHCITHVTDHQPHTCDKCNATFQSGYNLLRHIRNKHFPSSQPADTEQPPHQVAEEADTNEKLTNTESCTSEDDRIKTEKTTQKDTCSLVAIDESFSHTDRLSCELCGKTFASRRGLLRHGATHTNLRPFQCKECSISFTRLTHLKRHVLQKHLQSQCAHVCSLCSAPFADSYHLLRHMDSHTDSQPHSCLQCQAAFTTSRQLKNHLQSHTQSAQSKDAGGQPGDADSDVTPGGQSQVSLTVDGGLYSELDSGAGTSLSQDGNVIGSDGLDLRLAADEEADAGNVNIATSEKQASSRLSINDMTDKEGSKDPGLFSQSSTQYLQPCDSSETETVNNNSLQPVSVRKSERNKTASPSQANPQSSSSTKKHEKAEFAWMEYALILPSAHALNSSPHSMKLALKVYACTHPGCTRTFSCPSDLKRHKLNHTSERPYLCKHCGQSFKRPNAMKRHELCHLAVKPFKCEICSEAFARQSQLTRHSRTHHGQKPYVCVECGEAFREPANLTRHTRKHTGEKPYVCEWCGGSFTQAGNLKKHISAKHTGYKPHTCSHCGKGYTTTYLLAVHIRTHTGERPYVCKECGAGFRVISHLKDHMLKHTGERPKQCPLCSNSYTRSSHVKKHIRRMHPEHDPLTATQSVLSDNAAASPLVQSRASFTSTA